MYKARVVLKKGVTTRDDGVIKVSICGPCGQLGFLVFEDAAEDDVLSSVERNETMVVQ